MAKVTNPIATRTRSKAKQIETNSRTKKTQETNGKKMNRLIECHVRLNRLTQEQIMKTVANDLTEIKEQTSRYNLRSVNGKKSVPIKKAQKKHIVSIGHIVSNAIAKISPTDMTATRLWTHLKKECSTPPFKNLCCLAKMRSFSPWPAMVLELKGKATTVYFFGEGTTGTVQTTEIVPFEKCLALAKKYLNLKGYFRAVRELEIVTNIPQNASITINI